MDPSVQITIAAVGSMCSTITALVIVAILMRLLGEQQDSKVLCEIRLLREEVKGYRINNNYIVYDHTRNAIVGDVSAVVGREGGVTKFRPFGIDPKHAGERVRLLAILSNGEDARIF